MQKKNPFSRKKEEMSDVCQVHILCAVLGTSKSRGYPVIWVRFYRHMIFPFFSHEAGNLSPDTNNDAYLWLTGLFEDDCFAVSWVSLAQNTQEWRMFWLRALLYKLFRSQCRLIKKSYMSV